MIEHVVEGQRQPALPPVADEWHHHEFLPLTDRPLTCLVCGRMRVWRWHFGPFRDITIALRIRAS